MTARIMHAANLPGRVLVGPKKLRSCYARIVSQRDGSGRIERFDLESRTWSLAPESVTFSDVWSAPSVPSVVWAHIDGRPFPGFPLADAEFERKKLRR